MVTGNGSLVHSCVSSSSSSSSTTTTTFKNNNALLLCVVIAQPLSMCLLRGMKGLLVSFICLFEKRQTEKNNLCLHRPTHQSLPKNPINQNQNTLLHRQLNASVLFEPIKVLSAYNVPYIMYRIGVLFVTMSV